LQVLYVNYTYCIYIVALTMIKAHVFHTTSQYLVIIWITGLKILTGDITHKYKKILFSIGKYYRGPITWRTFNPGVELSPVNRVEIFCDYCTWTISTPGLKRYTIHLRHWFAEVKKLLFCFLVTNSHYHAWSNNSW
jgi:hypothetical protein